MESSETPAHYAIPEAEVFFFRWRARWREFIDIWRRQNSRSRISAVFRLNYRKKVTREGKTVEREPSSFLLHFEKVSEMSNFNLSIELHDIPWNEFHISKFENWNWANVMEKKKKTWKNNRQVVGFGSDLSCLVLRRMMTASSNV